MKDRQVRCGWHKLSEGSGLEDWFVKDRQVRCRRRKLTEGSGLEDWLLKDRQVRCRRRKLSEGSGLVMTDGTVESFINIEKWSTWMKSALMSL